MTATTPSFRMVCRPAALTGAPAGWATEMLRDGELALVADDGGLDAINRAAHDLELLAVPVVRGEADTATQERTVIGYAGPLPTIWVAAEFSDRAVAWARDRGPMTLLVTTDRPLDEDERARIGRFVALLARQSE
jgi:hypothetical protein